VADGLGVGDEKIWTGWTESLTWQLYRETSRFLEDSEGFRGRRSADRMALRKAVAENLPKDFEKEIDAHFSFLPERYFQTHPAAEIAEHLRLFRKFFENHVNTSTGGLDPAVRWIHHPHAGHSELWVCTWDRHQLLARICGTLAANELSILSADIFTREDSVVLDIFRVTTTRFEAVEDVRDQQRVEKLLREALAVESYDFTPILEKRLRRVQPWERALDFPTRITISKDANPNYTVVDISTPDRLALLYDILHTLSEAEFLIAAARITTEKGAAIDSFYITDLVGQKVVEPGKLARLNKALLKAARHKIGEHSA